MPSLATRAALSAAGFGACLKGKPATVSYIGFSSSGTAGSTASSATVPTGAQAGDLLFLCLVTGTASTTLAVPTGFTSVITYTTAIICYRVMQAGDSSFALSPSCGYEMMAFRKSSGAISVITSATAGPAASVTTLTAPSVTATASGQYNVQAVIEGQTNISSVTLPGSLVVQGNTSSTTYPTGSGIAVSGQSLASAGGVSGMTGTFGTTSAGFYAVAGSLILG